MNFYIFNFRSSSIKLFFMSLLATIILFSVPCFVLQLCTYFKTNKTQFLPSSAASKAKHLQLNFDKIKPDIIFIGSSKTMFHVDSGYLSNVMHMKSYNFGLNGHGLSSYPFIVSEAIKSRPKMIVIQLDVQELYSPLGQANDLFLSDLYAYFRTHQSMIFMMAAIKNYLFQFNLIRQHSSTIYNLIKQKYKVFSGDISKSTLSNNNNDIKQYGFCYPFERQEDSFQKINVVSCQNGDGILFGTAKNTFRKDKTLLTFNEDAIRLLTYMINRIKENNIIPVVVLSPSHDINYTFNRLAIQKMLGTKIIDFSNAELHANAWFDSAHLNDSGRKIYTNMLYQALLG